MGWLNPLLAALTILLPLLLAAWLVDLRARHRERQRDGQREKTGGR
jgi:hypothetical protein